MANEFLKVGYWDFVYEKFSQDYLKLITDKAERYKKLDAIDLMEVSEEEANNVITQLNYLDHELNIFYGLKVIVDDLKESYNNSITSLINEEKQKRKILKTKIINQLIQIVELKKENQMLSELSKITMQNNETLLNLTSKIISKTTSNEHS